MYISICIYIYIWTPPLATKGGQDENDVSPTEAIALYSVEAAALSGKAWKGSRQRPAAADPQRGKGGPEGTRRRRRTPQASRASKPRAARSPRVDERASRVACKVRHRATDYRADCDGPPKERDAQPSTMGAPKQKQKACQRQHRIKTTDSHESTDNKTADSNRNTRGKTQCKYDNARHRFKRMVFSSLFVVPLARQPPNE